MAFAISDCESEVMHHGKITKPVIRHFCTYPERGGAGIAAARLVSGLRDAGEDASLWGVNKPDGSESWVNNIQYSNRLNERTWRRLRKFQVERIHQRVSEGVGVSLMPYFSDLSPHGWAMAKKAASADLVHLHWVSDFIDYPHFFSNLPSHIPIVWTLHDMGAFTGGCIHSGGCRAYQVECGRCPALESEDPHDESYLSFGRKRRALDRFQGGLTIVTPSRWLKKRVEESVLLGNYRCEVIPNPLNLSIYHPGGRQQSRERYGVLDGSPVVLFVAASLGAPIKGLDILRQAVTHLGAKMGSAQIWCVGYQGSVEIPSGWRVISPPSSEDEMISLYSAADLLVIPSRVENYPNVICEALACGVPVVGSDVGGIPELVVEHMTGALFKKEDPVDLSYRLELLLPKIMESRELWSRRCSDFANETFGIKHIVSRYSEIYSQLIKS